MDTLVLPRPDDAHVHLRDGEALRTTVPATAATFGRAVIMPNLRPPTRTALDVRAYRERIVAAVPEGLSFEPLMTLYLTDHTTPEDILAARGVVCGVKLYPAGATTHSDEGVTDLRRLEGTLEAMEEEALPLLVHAESTDPEVDVFDREHVFLDRVLGPLVERHSRLRVVVEHITTRQGAAFVRGARAGVAATITPQHLLLNRNALFQGGIRPHHYCLPVLKREEHRIALLAAATSGDPRFFLGTDSAPHARSAKEATCGCAGCFTAPHALALYALAFERAGALDRLPDFAARFAAEFYRLPLPAGEIRLVRQDWQIPASWPLGEDEAVPLFAGETLGWRVA